MDAKGNPDPKPTEPQEESYKFPPCTRQPIVTQNSITGDVWLGFSPGAMSRRVALAWAAFRIENFFDQMDAQVAAAEKGKLNDKNLKDGKMSIKDILRMPFRR
jgi:hypothetical protein